MTGFLFFMSRGDFSVSFNGRVTAGYMEGRGTIWVVNLPHLLFASRKEPYSNGERFVAYHSIEVTRSNGLVVTAPKTNVRVGETVQLTVTEILPDGTTRDLTDSRTGTTYHSTSYLHMIPDQMAG